MEHLNNQGGFEFKRNLKLFNRESNPLHKNHSYNEDTINKYNNTSLNINKHQGNNIRDLETIDDVSKKFFKEFGIPFQTYLDPSPITEWFDDFYTFKNEKDILFSVENPDHRNYLSSYDGFNNQFTLGNKNDLGILFNETGSTLVGGVDVKGRKRDDQLYVINGVTSFLYGDDVEETESDGNDYLSALGGKGHSAAGNGGNDTIVFQNVTADTEGIDIIGPYLDGGSGNDTLLMRNVSGGFDDNDNFVAGYASGGRGNDTIKSFDSFGTFIIGGALEDSDEGVDTIYSKGGKLNIIVGDGGDNETITDDNGEDNIIFGFKGKDNIKINNFDNVTVMGGINQFEGFTFTDTKDIIAAKKGTNVYIDGEEGDDEITLTDVQANGANEQSFWYNPEDPDTFAFRKEVDGIHSSIVYGGKGIDQITANKVENVLIQGNDDNDIIKIDDISGNVYGDGFNSDATDGYDDKVELGASYLIGKVGGKVLDRSKARIKMIPDKNGNLLETIILKSGSVTGDVVIHRDIEMINAGQQTFTYDQAIKYIKGQGINLNSR